MKKQWMGLILVLGLLVNGAVWAAEEAAKDFTLPDLTGQNFKLTEVMGQKIIVLNFWAAWCTTCKEEIPQLADFQKTAKPGEAVFLGINAGDSAAKSKKFQDRNSYPYRVLVDPDKAVAKLYGITGVPQTVIIGKKGTIIYRGSRPPKEMPH